MKHAGLKLVLVLFLLGAIGIGCWLFLTPASSTTFRLPNGMIVRYLGAARGGTQFKTDKPWHKLARRALPSRWQSWIPQPINTTASGTSNNFTFYWDVFDPSGAAIIGTPWADCVAEDDEGFRYERSGGYSSSGGSAGRSMFALQLRVFPRRQPDLRFLFLDRSGGVLHAVRLPNPVHGPFPEWMPSPVPITRTNEPVVLTLAGLSEIVALGQHHYLRPDWRIASNDPLWSNAKPGSFQCEDATGNEGPFLSLKESAWKVRTWVHRQRSVDFTDNERLILTNLSIPNPGELQSLDVTGERAGVKLSVQCVAGAGTLYITNGTNRVMTAIPSGSTGWSSAADGKTTVTTLGSPTSFFLIEAVGVKPRDDIRFRALDEQGREVKLDSSSGAYGSGRANTWTYKRGFAPPDGVKSVTLEIIISRPREFEFVINPAEIKRAQPVAK
jgi:hypothetical protein